MLIRQGRFAADAKPICRVWGQIWDGLGNGPISRLLSSVLGSLTIGLFLSVCGHLANVNDTIAQATVFPAQAGRFFRPQRMHAQKGKKVPARSRPGKRAARLQYTARPHLTFIIGSEEAPNKPPGGTFRQGALPYSVAFTTVAACVSALSRPFRRGGWRGASQR